MCQDKQALQPDEDLYFDLDSVASTTECTGLIPTPPISDAEAESYTDLYTIPKPQKEFNGHQKHPVEKES